MGEDTRIDPIFSISRIIYHDLVTFVCIFRAKFTRGLSAVKKTTTKNASTPGKWNTDAHPPPHPDLSDEWRAGPGAEGI